MDPTIYTLVEQLLGTQDLPTAQALALKLQWAAYQHLEQIQLKSAEAGSAPSSDHSFHEPATTQV